MRKGAVLQSILERTHLYESDCLTSQYVRFGWSLINSWRDQGVRRICSTRGEGYCSYVLVMTLSETCSHQTCNSRRSLLFKLWISVAWSSRWEFNLAVLTEMLVYQIAVKNWQISKWAFEIWRGIHGILGLAHYEFQKFQINLKAKAHMCVHEGASGGSL